MPTTPRILLLIVNLIVLWVEEGEEADEGPQNYMLFVFLSSASPHVLMNFTFLLAGPSRASFIMGKCARRNVQNIIIAKSRPFHGDPL